MDDEVTLSPWIQNVRFLPAIDWNIKFFGAHEQRVDKHWQMPLESHIGFEMIFIQEGAQETIIGESKYQLGAGDFLLIPPGFKHKSRCVSEEGMAYFCAHFNVDDPAFRQEMIRNGRLLFPAGSADSERLLPILNQWIAMLRRGGGYTTADRFRLQADLFELFGLLVSTICLPEEELAAMPPASVQYAKAIAEAIKGNFDPHKLPGEPVAESAFRIEEIMGSLGISPGYGLEVFRKVYGLSPRQFLSELKLQEAKVLIRQPELSLKEIGLRLGYSQLSHFSRQFKRWTGMSPLHYRQQHFQQ